MKNQLQVLFDEHEIIVSATDIAKQAGGLLPGFEGAYEKAVRELFVFFRTYADEYHHHKEEKILFPEMSKKSELLEDGVLREMLENHDDFRGMIRSIEFYLGKKEYATAHKLLLNYTEALLDHIAVENDEVFQMAESLFSLDELERIGFRFDDCDFELASDKKPGQRDKAALVNQLEETRTRVQQALVGNAKV